MADNEIKQMLKDVGITDEDMALAVSAVKMFNLTPPLG